METTVKYGENEFTLKKEEGNWQTTILTSYTNIKAVSNLNLLLLDADRLVPMEVEQVEDEIIMNFMIDDALTAWEASEQLEKIDKLRLCANISLFAAFVDARQTCVLAPENMLYDQNLLPKMVYRGLKGYIEPMAFDMEEFLLQYKSLAIGTLSKKYDFNELYTGALKLAKESALIREIAQAESKEAIDDLLNTAYTREKNRIEKKMKLVPKGKYNFYARTTFFLLAVVLLLVSGISYLGFVAIPYQNTLLQASDTFLSLDFNATIETLAKMNPKNLPQTAKYELAYSYIQGEPLTNEQRAVVLNNISLKSDPNYLLYWVYSGNGSLDDALDIAKSLRDVQLTIYALEKKISALNVDTTLSGAAKEEELQKMTEQLTKAKESFEAGMAVEESTANQTTTA